MKTTVTVLPLFVIIFHIYNVAAAEINEGEILKPAENIKTVDNLGSDNRVYCLKNVPLRDAYLTKITAYFLNNESTIFQVWRKFEPGDGTGTLRYWLAHKLTYAAEGPAKETYEIRVNPVWKVFATDLMCFQTVGVGTQTEPVKTALLTEQIKGMGDYYYYKVDAGSDPAYGTIQNFNTGGWPWRWNFIVTLNTDMAAYSGITTPTPPTENSGPKSTTMSSTQTTSQTVQTTTKLASTQQSGTTQKATRDPGGVSTTGSTEKPNAASQTEYSGSLGELLKPGWVLALLIWCAVLTIVVIGLCCLLITKKNTEKKRKFYIDYLRRQNPYVESLRSKDYSWHDVSNNGDSSGGHVEADRSDIGIVNYYDEQQGTMRNADAQHFN